MRLADWFRRFFPSSSVSPEEDATLQDEYGTSPHSGPALERPDVPMAIPASGGTDPDARPGTPADAETDGP